MTPFDDFCNNSTLMVPEDAIDSYKVAAGWKVFKRIESLSGSGVDGVVSDEGCAVEYYNLQGLKVKPENLVQGIYVVRQGNKAAKVYVNK